MLDSPATMPADFETQPPQIPMSAHEEISQEAEDIGTVADVLFLIFALVLVGAIIFYIVRRLLGFYLRMVESTVQMMVWGVYYTLQMMQGIAASILWTAESAVSMTAWMGYYTLQMIQLIVASILWTVLCILGFARP